MSSSLARIQTEMKKFPPPPYILITATVLTLASFLLARRYLLYTPEPPNTSMQVRLSPANIMKLVLKPATAVEVQKAQTCAICREEEISMPVTTPCGHTYCNICICNALAQQSLCPLCARDVFKDAGSLRISLTIDRGCTRERREAITTSAVANVVLLLVLGWPYWAQKRQDAEQSLVLNQLSTWTVKAALTSNTMAGTLMLHSYGVGSRLNSTVWRASSSLQCLATFMLGVFLASSTDWRAAASVMLWQDCLSWTPIALWKISTSVMIRRWLTAIIWASGRCLIWLLQKMIGHDDERDGGGSEGEGEADVVVEDAEAVDGAQGVEDAGAGGGDGAVVEEEAVGEVEDVQEAEALPEQIGILGAAQAPADEVYLVVLQI